jgi:hypothetical protein
MTTYRHISALIKPQHASGARLGNPSLKRWHSAS